MAANFQQTSKHYGCWKFAGRLLVRVNTPLFTIIDSCKVPCKN